MSSKQGCWQSRQEFSISQNINEIHVKIIKQYIYANHVGFKSVKVTLKN
jgi:hypothetical protein